MHNKCCYSPKKWICGIICLCLGIGMFLGYLIPYCIPILAVLLIAGGSWILCHFKCH